MQKARWAGTLKLFFFTAVETCTYLKDLRVPDTNDALLSGTPSRTNAMYCLNKQRHLSIPKGRAHF